MSTPLVGEIRIFGFGRTPVGWLACDGASVSISAYEVLFTLIGTTCWRRRKIETSACRTCEASADTPGNRRRTLTPRALGASGGSESVTLLLDQLPSHTHTMYAPRPPPRRARTPGSGYDAGASASMTNSTSITSTAWFPRCWTPGRVRWLAIISPMRT
ncbi:phage tail protein [Caulobacter segnis]